MLGLRGGGRLGQHKGPPQKLSGRAGLLGGEERAAGCDPLPCLGLVLRRVGAMRCPSPTRRCGGERGSTSLGKTARAHLPEQVLQPVL